MSALAASRLSGMTASRRRGHLKRAVNVGLGSLLFGLISGVAAAGGHASALLALLAIFPAVAVWLRPQLGPFLLLLTGLLVEQFPLGLRNGWTAVGVPITQSIPMFQGLGSFHLEPTDLLPVVIFLVYMIRSSHAGHRWWPRTQLSLGVLVVIGFVLFAEVNGLANHGDMRESLFECRPFIYFGAAYVLTALMIRTRSAVQAMLWAIVAAELIKSLQGTDVWWTTRNWHPRPESVLGHEEAMFFSLFFLLVAALWLFDIRGRLRTVATLAFPVVLFTDMVNDRRAAWLILGAGLIVLVAIGYQVVPRRRAKLRRILLVAAFVTAIYLPAYWNHTDGTLGKPADAVRSAFSPSARDALSNEYRNDEDANLKFNIEQDGVLGAGFGRLIDYALPMPGLVTAADAGITYVPHNTNLYLLMRMGLLGASAFWAMLGAAIIAGCRLARCPDRLFGVVGTIVAAMTVGWALEGATDLGFTFPRIAMVMGCLFGLLEASRHIHLASRSTCRARLAAASAHSRLGRGRLGRTPLAGVVD
jgi:hypothetical protein